MPFLNCFLKILDRSFILSYIDAGTGSMIIQVIIGSAAGVILALKMSWKKLKNWVKHNPPVKEKLDSGQDNLVEH